MHSLAENSMWSCNNRCAMMHKNCFTLFALMVTEILLFDWMKAHVIVWKLNYYFASRKEYQCCPAPPPLVCIDNSEKICVCGLSGRKMLITEKQMCRHFSIEIHARLYCILARVGLYYTIDSYHFCPWLTSWSVEWRYDIDVFILCIYSLYISFESWKD